MSTGKQSTLNDLSALEQRIVKEEGFSSFLKNHGFDKAIQFKEVSDFNSLTETGFYGVNAVAGCKNMPSGSAKLGDGSTWFFVEVKQHPHMNDYYVQEVVSYFTDGLSARRTCHGVTRGWNPWNYELNSKTTITDVNGFIKKA